MTFFPDRMTILSVGPISIKWYALFFLGGALAMAYYSYREMKKAGYDSTVFEDLALGSFISGIIGARLWYCVFYDFQYYFSDPIRILKIYEGGLAIQGGVLLGILYGWWYTRKKKISFFRMADMIVPNLLLAQAIGRWGNFMNQEAHGGVVSEAYFKNFPTFIKEGMYIQGSYYLPTFLYESVLNITGFLVFVYIFKKFNDRFHFLKRGDGMYFYLTWYGASRYIVEGLRTDSLMLGNFRMAQLTSVAFIVVGVLGLLGFFRALIKPKKPIVLFDLDGTLLDTEEAIIETYRYLFKKHGKEEQFTKEVELETLGPPLKELFDRYFEGMDQDALVEEYRTHNFELHKTSVKLMDHAKETLDFLNQEGYSVGVVSSKHTDGIELGLKQFGLENLVQVVVGLNSVEKAKPHPEGIFLACKELNRGHDACLYIGDSATDIQAAKNAGVYSIGYQSHADRKEVLAQANPNRLISDLAEIKDIVKENQSWTYNMM